MTDLKQLSKHLTFANAISCVALFVALSGAAYAATTLGKKSVKTQNLANGAVTTLKLKGGSVTNLKLRNGAVTGNKIAPGTIGSSLLANGSVRSNQLAANAVSNGKLQDGAVSSTKLASSFLAQLVKNVTYVGKASGAVSESSPQSVTAECPTGRQVVGGGSKIILGTAKEAATIESVPFVATNDKRTGWTAAAIKPEADAKTFAVEAIAICAEF
jgi:hypothetical protein